MTEFFRRIADFLQHLSMNLASHVLRGMGLAVIIGMTINALGVSPNKFGVDSVDRLIFYLSIPSVAIFKWLETRPSALRRKLHHLNDLREKKYISRSLYDELADGYVRYTMSLDVPKTKGIGKNDDPGTDTIALDKHKPAKKTAKQPADS